MARSGSSTAVAANTKRKRTEAADGNPPAKRQAKNKVASTPTRVSARTAEAAAKRIQMAKDAEEKAKGQAQAEARKRVARQAAPEKAAATKVATKSKTSKTSTAAATKNAKKPAATKQTSKQALGKRARNDDDESATKKPRIGPKPKATPRATKPAVPKPQKLTAKIILNEAPKARLQLFVFGEGGSGELGLGATDGSTEVTRPRYNAKLAPDTVGVVQLAAGAMHGVALTHDNQILTWGNADKGTIARENDGQEELDDDTGLSPFDATPTPIKLPAGIVFTQVAASDNGGHAVTDDGFVYGWGSFKNGEGKHVFSYDKKTNSTLEFQSTLTKIDGLKNIKKIATGANHVLALDTKGNVFAWGFSDQGECGRRPIERRPWNTLTPTPVALPKGNKIIDIFAAGFNSFALDRNGKVFAWGANSSAQAGIARNAGEQEAVIYKPEIIKAIPKPAAMVAGGSSHTVVATQDGDLYIWGKATDGLMGFKDLPEEHLAYSDSGKGSMLLVPTKLPNLPPVKFISASTRANIAVTEDGDAYSWGYNDSYDVGQGADIDTVEVATKIASKKKIVVAGAGSGWGYIAAEADVPAN